MKGHIFRLLTCYFLLISIILLLSIRCIFFINGTRLLTRYLDPPRKVPYHLWREKTGRGSEEKTKIHLSSLFISVFGMGLLKKKLEGISKRRLMASGLEILFLTYPLGLSPRHNPFEFLTHPTGSGTRLWRVWLLEIVRYLHRSISYISTIKATLFWTIEEF